MSQNETQAAAVPDTEALGMSIEVRYGPDRVFALDAANNVEAPATASMRAHVAIALARASAALAALPEASSTHSVLQAVIDQLRDIGTPAAADALDALHGAIEGQTEALGRATGIIAAATAATVEAIPTAPGTH